MKWKGRSGSDNIEDRRGGGSNFNPLRGGNRKFSFITIIIIVVALYFGKDPMQFLQMGNEFLSTEQETTTTGVKNTGRSDDEMAHFVEVVLKDTEDVWTKVFREQLNSTYKKPILVMFSGHTTSACGAASASTGPFYCPVDEKVYIDLSFYNQLVNNLGGGGDFAMAYVIAHEVGHHVQKLLGISDKVHELRRKISEEEYNELSVRLELQADFFAGVWAKENQSMNHVLEEGDIEEAMNAANAIGDDRLQKQAQGYAVPETFTHGTSQQRMKWFMKGFETGDMSNGDTFSAKDL
ncbi:MAG: neutral zinc metallopeptidase [Bacteroidota bacterium]